MVSGIYPGGVAGTDTGLTNAKPDDPALIKQAFTQLQQANKKIIIRAYIHYNGSDEFADEAPLNAEQYAVTDHSLDLVLCYRTEVFNEVSWKEIIKKMIDRYGNKLHSIQITEEPNLKNVFAGDGNFKDIDRALFTGVTTAKEEIINNGLNVKIGFNSVPSFDPTDTFWNMIGSQAFFEFRNAIDYVGLDFFPDVFRRTAPDGEPNDVVQSVTNVLRYFRNVRLTASNIPASTPIHICENGWPTGEGRTYEGQSEILEKIIRTIHSISNELNIT
jgi:hypothetical protein